MLDFFMQVQQSAGGGGSGGEAYNNTGTYPSSPTHMIGHINDAGNSAGGLIVYDITTRDAVTKTAIYTVSGNTLRNQVLSTTGSSNFMCVKNNVCYFFADGLPGGRRIEAFDVSDPTTLTASQQLGSVIDVTAFNGFAFLGAHPSKDILWAVGDDYISTIDISNPASMSIIQSVATPSNIAGSGAISADGEYLFFQGGATIQTYRAELNASNEPSNITSFSSPDSTRQLAGMSFNTSPISGNNYLFKSEYNLDNVYVNEMGVGYTNSSTQTYSANPPLDNTRCIMPMDYYQNYSTSDSVAFAVSNLDDFTVSIISFNDSSNAFTELATRYGGSAVQMRCMTVVDKYIYTFHQSNRNFYHAEWASLNSLLPFVTNSVNSPTSYLVSSSVAYAP